jgi:monolysocardiolipin acyltransferase
MDPIPTTSEEMHHAIRHWIPEERWYKPVVCRIVVGMSRFIMTSMNRLEFIHRDRWEAAFAHEGRGVLTFSNHVSLFDDPLLISNLGATRYDEVRWIPADHRNFFSSAMKGALFSCGKCVPIIRGAGLEQPGFDFLLERLRAGDWVHIFPEGGRTREADARLRTPFKIGIGRLLAEAHPIAIPFYHRGMHDVLPIGASRPRAGNEVAVHFGEPTGIDEGWMHSLAPAESSPTEQWQAATDWAQGRLEDLESAVLSGGRDPTAPP